MFRKMTCLARGLKCGVFGASGSASVAVGGRSAASSSEMIPGNSNDPPTRERIIDRRLYRNGSVIQATFHGPSSVHKNKLVGTHQCSGQRGPRLQLKLAWRRLEGC